VKHRACSVIAFAVATASAAGAKTPPVVRVFVAGSPAAVSGTRDALRDRCARPDLNVSVEDAASVAGAGVAGDAWSIGTGDAGASAPSADAVPGAPEGSGSSREAVALGAGHPTDFAVGYVEISSNAASRVVVVDGRTQAELERRSLAPAPSLEMSLETVAQIICAAIDSTLATRARAPATNPLPPPLPPPHGAAFEPLPATPEGSALLGWAGAFGAGSDYGAGFRGGVGGLFGGTLGSKAWRASLLVTGTYFPSSTLEREGASASLGLFGGRLLPAAAFRASTDVELVLGAGGGFDWFRVSADKPPPGGTAQNGTNSVDPMLSALLATRLKLSTHFGFWLGAAVDLDLNPHRYVNEASGEPVTFFEPPRLRGTGQAGLAVTFGRDGAEAARPTTVRRGDSP
jgi:hypothetical protein